MLTASHCKRLLAVCVGLVLVPLLLSAGPKASADKMSVVAAEVVAEGSSVPAPQKKIERESSRAIGRAEPVLNKLNHPMRLTSQEFKPEDEIELQSLLLWLGERYNINFVFDHRAFEGTKVPDPEKTGIRMEKPLRRRSELRIKDTVRGLLSQIPCERNLTYIIIDNTVVITTEEMAPYRWMRQGVSVDCDKEELKTALHRLALETATNLVVDPRAAEESKKPVTMQVNNAPLEDVVTVMAEMADLKPIRVGNILFLTTKEKAAEMRADPERKHAIGPCPLPPNDKVPPLP